MEKGNEQKTLYGCNCCQNKLECLYYHSPPSKAKDNQSRALLGLHPIPPYP